MSRLRALDAVCLLGWLLACCATAALAHGVIELIGEAGVGADDYSQYPHRALGPVTLAALVFAGTALLVFTLSAVERSSAIDHVALLTRRLKKTSPPLSCLAVAMGGGGTLLGMEFGEQACAFGQIRGLSEALGGNVPVGLAAVFIVAALITVSGLHSARALASGAVSAVGILVAWIPLKNGSPVDSSTLARRRLSIPLRFTLVALARCFGLRAPPAALI